MDERESHCVTETPGAPRNILKTFVDHDNTGGEGGEVGWGKGVDGTENHYRLPPTQTWLLTKK